MKVKLIFICLLLYILPGCVNKHRLRDNDARPGAVMRPDHSGEKDEIYPPASDSKSGSLYERCKPAVFMVHTSDGFNKYQGSGFFISSSGIGISNYHVFKGTEIGLEEITLSDGNKYKIREILARNEKYDYIIFQIDNNRPVPYLKVAARDPAISDPVFAIGNPRGVDHVYTEGKVSKIEECYILTQTPITHGNSGGPLMNMKGEVVGITSGNISQVHEQMFNYAISIQYLQINKYLK
ncbi:MAG: S1C family serine protease [Tannerellaceae bacterium]|nr:S1C family serine protease [Tannerellaceae bacterium]